MLLAVDKNNALGVLKKYFSALSNFGYVKHTIVRRYLLWLFLVDFVEQVYLYLTNEDYNKINKALICLFSSGSCLMPYMTDRANVTFGEPIYMGRMTLRATEDGMWRATEDGRLRIMED